MIAGLNNWNTMPLLWILADTAAKKADESKIDKILDFLNNNSMIGWGIAGFAVIVLATAAIAKWTGNLEKIIVFAQKYLSRKKPEITEAQRQKVRADLIKILLKQVVKRLEDSLHHKIRIDLRREEQRQRVGKGNLAPVQEEETEQAADNFIKRTFQHFRKSTPPQPFRVNKSTQELFEQEDIQGRLLILGEPGSGKTNELLVLARDLLSQARNSPDKPIPVIFELSEWNAELEFADWLGQQLLEKYNVPIIVSKHWVSHEQVLPLLDGLDELRRVDEVDEITTKELDTRRIAKQIQCVRDINAFLDTSSLPLVVCCRRKEYEAIEVQGEYLKRLNGAIYLQALEDEQIREYLKRLNRESLWEAIKNQPALLKLAHSPLFLLVLIVAYQKQNIRSTEELLDEYIHKQLHDLNNQGAYPPGKAPSPEEAHHYLSWLASKLESEGTTEFLIEKLQPSWLDTPQAKSKYYWTANLIYSSNIGLFGGLIIGLFIEQFSNLIIGIISGLIFGLIKVLYDNREGYSYYVGMDEIKKAEKLSLVWNRYFTLILILGLFTGLININQGLTKMLVGSLIGVMYSGGLYVFSSLCLNDSSSNNKYYEFLGGLEICEIDVQDKLHPNQGIRDSMINGLGVGLGVGLFFGFIFWLATELDGTSNFGLRAGPIFGLMIAMIYGLPIGLTSGLNAVYQHLSLRIALYQSGVSPWNYARFLEHAENHRFIQRTGGRYRFVHDLLRKRFAATLRQS